MATTPTSTPAPKTNRAGLTVLDYRGGKTTLCAGCGVLHEPLAPLQLRPWPYAVGNDGSGVGELNDGRHRY